MHCEEIDHPRYGRCVAISNSIATLMVTLDYGPRIIHFSLDGFPNIMFVNTDPEYVKKGPDFDRVFHPGAYWNIRGGNRLWIAPHSFPDAFYPDNEPVEWQTTEFGARFMPPARRTPRAQIMTDIALDDEKPEVIIHHEIINIGSVPRTWAAWSITAVCADGIEIIPWSDKQTGVLPNRHFSLWPYSDIADPRLVFSSKYISIRHDANRSSPLKIGLNNENGKAWYIAAGQIFSIEYNPDPAAAYPDFNVNYETFADDRMVEMEVLSPLKKLEPGERVDLTEKWSLSVLPSQLEKFDIESIISFIESNDEYSNGINPKGMR